MRPAEENGYLTVEITFVFLMILLCLAGFFAVGIRTHDAAMAAVAAEAFLQDETAEAAQLDGLARELMLGDGEAFYTKTTEGLTVSVRFTTWLSQTYMPDALAGPAAWRIGRIREITRRDLPEAALLRIVRAARKIRKEAGE